MRIVRPGNRPTRRGTVVPMVALCLVGLFGFVSLAVDLGMLAVSRTECQNGADVAALVGCRTLNNKPGVVNSNLASAVPAARTAATSNPHLSARFTEEQVAKIEVGQYLYDTAGQRFLVPTWTDVTGGTATAPATGSWTAMRVTLSVSQPTYFMKVFGVSTMPCGAVATAVYRPRDVAFAVDMTGSMAYASKFNFGGKSLNPDPLVMVAGHYAATRANLVATANQANSDQEAYSRNNYTITTPGGPPIVRNFYFAAANSADPSVPVTTVPTKQGQDPDYPNDPTKTVTTADLLNAFHRWNPPESGGDPDTYTAPTIDFTGYNAFHTGTESNAKGPTPAPGSFGTMTDSGGVTYVGDRYRRGDGSINKTDTSWGTGSVTTRPAYHAADLLGYSFVPAIPAGFAADWSNFRDPLWEAHGYDLDVAKYRSLRGDGGPMDPAEYLVLNGNDPQNILVPQADRFVGYSMGPGYWGKSFYVWPPDPRFDPAADVTKPDPNRPAFDTAGKPMCDWRRRFFVRTAVTVQRTQTTANGTTFTTTGTSTATTTAPLDPQADSNNRNGPTFDGVNEVVLRSAGTNVMTLGATSGVQGVPRTTTITNTTTGAVTTTTDTVTQNVENYRVNYPAVLKWLKTGPQVLPPNLRAGRVLYYSSIPDDVDAAAGTDQQKLDKLFWKRYIDYVLGVNTYASSSAYLYGYADSWSASPAAVFTGAMGSFKFAWEPAALYPYMRYTDSPYRPRLHAWFGPLSMLDFLGTTANWLPGTCYEAQCWQLKAGLNSVISDVRANHPNDYLGLVMFAADSHNNIRVPMGQNYKAMKNALFYPKSLLPAIGAGDVTGEIRPYTSTFGSVPGDEIPNASGSTDPNTALAYAYNLLSSSAALPANYSTTANVQQVRGRRGAAKLVILETDGVPNAYRGLSATTKTMDPTLKGYDTFYPQSGWSSGNVGNGVSPTQSEAIKVVRQIVKLQAATNSDGADSGLSLPNAPAKVYPVAFGDLFDVGLAPDATYRPTALQFLADIAVEGNTLPAPPAAPAYPTTLPDYQIITGSYSQRIDRLRECMKRIFQSGVSVILVE